MDNSDLEVAKMLNEHKTKAYGSLEEGVYIKEKLYEFERVSLFEDKFSIMLPKDFVDMPENIKKMKYLAEQRPQIIKTIPTGGIDIGFSLLDAEIMNEQVLQHVVYARNAMKKINPSITVFHTDKMEDEEKTIAWMDFMNTGLDGGMYNIMYLIPIGGKTVHGIFNCSIYEREIWNPIQLEIMKSIKVDKVNR